MKNTLFSRSVSMKTKSLKPAKNQAVESDSFTKKDAMAWFDATYRTGSDLANDPFVAMRALEFFKKASNEGDLDSMCCLGVIYITPSAAGIPDVAKGRQLLERAACGNNVGAAYCLARFCESQQKKNDEEVVRWFQIAAEGGHPRAQYYLGLRYEQGRGAEKNEEMALKYLRQAAKQGHKEARSYLRIKYNEIHDDEKDDEARTLLSPVRSAKDADEVSIKGVLALLSPRRESRASTEDESLSIKKNRKPSMVKGELSPKRENAEPSMIKSPLSPKRESGTEESGKATSTWALSPKSNNRRENDIPELKLGGNLSSMKDASPKSNRKPSMVKKELSPPRENTKPSMVKSLLSPKKERKNEESRKATSTWQWLSPKTGSRREDELTLGGFNSMRDPCQSITGRSSLSSSYGSIRRRREPRGTFLSQKINEDGVPELTLGSSNSMRDSCEPIVESPKFGNSYGSTRTRKAPVRDTFWDQKNNGDNTIKEELSKSLQLGFESGNKKHN